MDKAYLSSYVSQSQDHAYITLHKNINDFHHTSRYLKSVLSSALLSCAEQILSLSSLMHLTEGENTRMQWVLT